MVNTNGTKSSQCGLMVQMCMCMSVCVHICSMCEEGTLMYP